MELVDFFVYVVPFMLFDSLIFYSLLQATQLLTVITLKSIAFLFILGEMLIFTFSVVVIAYFFYSNINNNMIGKKWSNLIVLIKWMSIFYLIILNMDSTCEDQVLKVVISSSKLVLIIVFERQPSQKYLLLSTSYTWFATQNQSYLSGKKSCSHNQRPKINFERKNICKNIVPQKMSACRSHWSRCYTPFSRRRFAFN